MEFTKEMLLSTLRTILGAAFGWMVAKGWLTTEDALSLSVALATILATVGWIWYKNKVQQKTVNVALALPIGAGAIDLKAEMASPSPQLPPIEKQVK